MIINNIIVARYVIVEMRRYSNAFKSNRGKKLHEKKVKNIILFKNHNRGF